MNKQMILKSGWNTINWPKVSDFVFKLQQEIYTASKEGDLRKIRRLQHKLLKSSAAKYVAVRRVTQDNRRAERSSVGMECRKVTAGVDGVKRVAPTQRIELASSLKFPTKASVLRRVWIPKPGTAEKRPLGIPTIKDRCLQALLKLALEPEWEAYFEPNSYGFRPGRGAHDAVKAVWNSVIKGQKYVLDADISKCFDRIDHDALLKKINFNGSLAKQLKYWLKAGVIDGNTFNETPSGTPQGGIISPLLANIALHGLENHLKEWIANSGQILYSRTGKKLPPNAIKESLHIIRYADDFVILHKDKHIVTQCKVQIDKFLADLGLELSATKTRLTHTLELKDDDTSSEGFDGEIGFNFIGFTIKQYKTRHRSAKTTTGELLGFKTLVFPSKKSMNNHQKSLHDLILSRGKNLNQLTLIKKINPLIRGWATYFGISDAGTTGHLNKADYWTYLKLRRWAKRKTGDSDAGTKYWRRIGTEKWVFNCDGGTLLKHKDYSNPIGAYTKVLGESSIFDNTSSIYWSKRMKNFPGFNKRIRLLLTRQKACCKWCGAQFQFDDVMEVDHIKPIFLGGRDIYTNLQLLHVYCHDQKSMIDRKTHQTPKNLDSIDIEFSEEPYDGKLSRTVPNRRPSEVTKTPT
jgi:RNA-directed DNA polymerase